MQLINGTTGIEEFSQGRVIDALLGNLPEKHHNYIQNGMCYALSLEWACGARLATPAQIASLLPYVPVGPFQESTLSYYKQIANNFIAYCDTLDTTFGADSRKLLAGAAKLPSKKLFEIDRYMMDLWSRQTIQLLDNYDFSHRDEFETIAGLPYRTLLMGIDLQGGGGHEVAFISNGAGLYFFDPNFGVYDVNNAAVLFDSLNTIYRGITHANISAV